MKNEATDLPDNKGLALDGNEERTAPEPVMLVVQPLPESEDVIVKKRDRTQPSPERGRRYNAKLLKVKWKNFG